ncbi:MAG: RNA polymerase sigma factor [Rikenellaceae bacterium]
MKEDLLIKESITGDKRSFELLFNMYSKQIKNTLIRLSGNEFDSNDLLQETFMKAYTNLDKYDFKYPFGVWLNAIAKNTFLDYMRKNSVKNRILIVDSDRVSEMEVEDVDDNTVANERSDMLMSKIADMEDKYKVVMELRYKAGLDYKDIAKELDMSIDTVKTRLRRGKEKLK